MFSNIHTQNSVQILWPKLLSDFQNKWIQQNHTGIGEKINDVIKPKGALKPQVQNGIKRLQTQITKTGFNDY